MKKYLPDLLVVLMYAVLSFAYFFPADIENRILFQHDTTAGAGAGQEAARFHQETGETTRWTNSLFGGMPTYQIAPSYDSTRPLTWIQKVYQLFLPTYVNLTFILMLGFFILLRAFGIPSWLAGLGGLMWAFSSYFFILVSAGHIWKFITLAYIPPTIAGMVLAYRGKLLAGGLVTALFVALQIMSNHVQMSYYFLFVILFMVIAYLVDAYRNKTLPQFWRASGVLVVAALVGISINLSNLYHTYSYSKETMRGKGELVETGHAAAQNSGGLDKNYITGWSYGIGETLTLLVPNYKGSASAPLAQNETAMEKANPMYISLYHQLPQYFGEQPGTSGPVYVGAFVLFLFLLGCFIVKGAMKWALVAATLFSILLSWGKNFMPLTDFFIDYVPMYDKFRAVSSILVIAEFTIPLLAIFALKQLLDTPALLKTARKAVYLSFALTAGVALLLYLSPGLLGNTFVPAREAQMLQGAVEQNMVPASELAGILQNLGEVRAAMVSRDALYSFVIIGVSVALLWLYSIGKLNKSLTVALIAVITVGNLWAVNKRYLHDSQFVPDSAQTESFKQSAADVEILKDPAPDFRVLNFAGDTFNENHTSYWHKSIGGYHAAKLRRYQEMIEHHISPEMQTIAQAGGNIANLHPDDIRVLNMLNTRYFIFPTQGGKEVAVSNPYSYGNAWFVSGVRYVSGANAEIDALSEIVPTDSAVVDVRFREALQGITASPKDSLAAIRLTAYQPNHLVYAADNARDGIAVFSEIYYPHGWSATIDGQPAAIARADYILRAMHIPAGKHVVEMRFDPASLHITEGIAYGGWALLLCGAVGFMLLIVRKKR
ncbi:MAG: YfhO family protein [Prevotellaceae bacterium]|jgi:hypothetical protein|nr:YfhO family protein [Prevotellaceae bacterium]